MEFKKIFKPLILSQQYFTVFSIFLKYQIREEFVEADRPFVSKAARGGSLSEVSTESVGVSSKVPQKNRPFCGSRLFVEARLFSDDTGR